MKVIGCCHNLFCNTFYSALVHFFVFFCFFLFFVFCFFCLLVRLFVCLVRLLYFISHTSSNSISIFLSTPHTPPLNPVPSPPSPCPPPHFGHRPQVPGLHFLIPFRHLLLHRLLHHGRRHLTSDAPDPDTRHPSPITRHRTISNPSTCRHLPVLVPLLPPSSIQR